MARMRKTVKCRPASNPVRRVHAFRLPHKEIDWQWQVGKPTGAENRVERGRGGGRAAKEAC